MIPRPRRSAEIRRLLRDYPVVGLLGARQVGKTTLALDLLRRRFPQGERFDLEDPADLARLADPRLTLGRRRGLVVIDEVQRRPDLFPVLRVLVDRRPLPARFLVLGSASPELLQQSSESLAGRIAYHTLTGLDLEEVGAAHLDRLWLRGGFPSSFTARTDEASHHWRTSFVRTFLERDLPGLGIRVETRVLERFWAMLAHYHGQVWNGSEIAASLGVSDKTARHYLDILASALVVRPLAPWHENLGKRVVKSPKVYFSDPGLLHVLLGVHDWRDLERHPRMGASWEGFLLQQVMERLRADPREVYFWAAHGGPEIDLVWVRGRRRWGFEFKRTSAPTLSRSLQSAKAALGLQRVFVVHGGDETFPLAPGVTALAAAHLLDLRPR